MFKRFLMVGLLLLLVACGDTPPPGPAEPPNEPIRVEPSNPAGPVSPSPDPASQGDISGTITYGNGANFSGAAFVPGEVIVRFESRPSSQTLSSLRVQGETLSRVRSLQLPSAELYRTPGLSEAETLELVESLKARPDVADAVPNYLFYTTRVPNDPLYANQWHYSAINLPAAWDKTTGSSNVTVAVIDTGILPHPDFSSRLLPGYDFVSSTSFSGDGNGRDSDPTDPGPYSKTFYHGTHVAGTIGAASNNGSGVAGVNWQARILPVRALGPSSTGSGAVGTLADVTDAALWAAGLSVSGVPANPNPADILNFSLGGNVPCSSIQQEAFNRITAANKIVVVAAGNGSLDAGSFSPANCNGVIVVGATTRDGRRASYSNYGPRVNLMAPGGDAGNVILSLGKDDVAGNGTYDYIGSAGTSMASPHVAGIISLMKALKPSLTSAEALRALASSARPLSDAQCDANTTGITLRGSDCGAGLVDAASALEVLGSSPAPAPTPTPSPAPVDLTGMQVFACSDVVNNTCTIAQQVAVTGEGETVSYRFRNLPAGTYVIVAWKDVNGNGYQDAGDIEGNYKNGSFVATPASNINITVTKSTGSPSSLNLGSSQ
jgi:serine protease